ncbi:unnamed protein product [Adineta steineri]|uniref:MYND-type domain-containing protein n=1 Tax=Adineta steineri TaxID=433720 RepID=A0A819GMS4_9BILA|nr:unnamed protein product [Adineta steineri]
MPTDSNERPISSSSSTTVVIPSMSTITSSINNKSLSSNQSRTPPIPTRSNSPSQSLNKLKRFLSTLYHFGSDISNEVGERVRTLILALVNNALSVEEFHSKVQAATNFPLRPFALPFLKSTLPLLQKDLSQLAHHSKQSTSQYLAQNEDLIFLARDVLDKSNSPSITNFKEQINEKKKRKLSDDTNEFDERPYATKRSSVTINHRSFISSNISNNLLTSTSIRRDIRDKERAFTAYLRQYESDLKDVGNKNKEDEWKNAENMLNYILEMVTKAKRVIFMLQEKDNHLHRLLETCDLEWRRRHADLLTHTEVRISEVRRKAEETVLEIKRQSINDLQKAVLQTEQKSNEILTREREQYQRLNQELKTQTFEEAYAVFNRQEDGPEQCWHCGRKAIETCSGCNIARYCGQYCQHRDWELHQKLCGSDLKRKFSDSSLLYRRSHSKFNINISSNHQKDVTRKNSDATTTPYLDVSSPLIDETITMIKSNDNSDNKSEIEKIEVNTSKSENI